MKTAPLNSFLKFYVVRTTGNHLYGKAHVKVGVIMLQKMYSYHTSVRKVCLNYMFCTMCPLPEIPIFYRMNWAVIRVRKSKFDASLENHTLKHLKF